MADRDLATPIIKYVGDRALSYTWTVQDENGDAIDLTGWSLDFIRFHNVLTEAVVVGNGTLTFEDDRQTGQVTYAWGTTDLATEGTYDIIVRFDTTGGDLNTTVRALRQLIVRALPAPPSP